MKALNEAALMAIELEHWRTELRELLLGRMVRDAEFFRSIRKDPRVIDVEFTVLPDVKGELTNGST